MLVVLLEVLLSIVSAGGGHEGDTVAHLEGINGPQGDPRLSPIVVEEKVNHGKNDPASKHLLHAKKWGRDPQLCEEFFTEGAAGRCPERDTCCGLLNATTKYFHIDIYCCHDTEKCCQGQCCGDHTVCCQHKSSDKSYGQCCDKNRGCCTDLRGNAVCCQTMLGRYWWVIAVILTVYLASKTAMMVRRYRAMPDVGKDRLIADQKLSVRIKSMTYCC